MIAVLSEDAPNLIKKFDALRERIERIPREMAETMTNWERDWNRQRPGTYESGPDSVTTVVWEKGKARRAGKALARGIAYGVRAHLKSRRTGTFQWSAHSRVIRMKRARTVRGVPARRRAMITRPVLRPELMDQLQDSMRELVERSVVWR
jgi:hypothetical protein